MLELLYLVCIAPLEFCMQIILRWGFYTTASYGLALILMSLAVNTVILPIYNKVEGWQEEERALKARMAPMETMIREVFKGQERFAMISTLYRQHGYSQFMTLRASIGVLLQIPFFFAAYHLLSNMEALHGVSFGPIRDLGAPDELFVIGVFSINVLPILMTVVNLVSAFFYTHDLSRRDKIQLYGMAALFLVLLYNSPAALTFYWMLNNVYSLGKNIVEKDWMKRKGWKDVVQKAQAMSVRLNGLEHLGVVALLSSLGFAAAKVLGLITEQGRFLEHKAVLMPLLKSSVSLVILLFLLLLLAWVLQKRFSCLLWFLFALASAAVWEHGIHYQHAMRLTAAFLLTVLFYRTGRFSKLTQRLAERFRTDELNMLDSRALLLMALLVFAYTPARLMLADQSFASIHTFAFLTVGILLAVTVPLLVFNACRNDIRVIFSFLVCSLSFVFVVYTFFVVRDYGILDAYAFERASLIKLRWYKYVDMAVCLPILGIVAFLFYKNRVLLGRLLAVALTMTIALGGISYARLLFAEPETVAATQTGPQKHLRLSRTSPNVLVVMLDAFTGDHIGNIMKEHPHLLASFEGFTWFPDTISAAESTHMSLPAIIAGEGMACYSLTRDDGRSLEEKIGKGVDDFVSKLRARGFSTKIAASNNIDYIAGKRYVEHAICKDYAAAYHGKTSGREEYIPGIFAASYGLFEAAPWSLRKNIYRKGRWFFSGNSALDRCVEHYSVLERLADMTSIDNGGASYNLFINELAHLPWSISKETLRPMDGDPYPETVEIMEMRGGLIPEHYYSEMAALKMMGEFFDFLKRENVYDNTLIVMVSDHCSGDSQPLSQTFGNPSPKRALITYSGRPNALYMVKGFQERGSLRIDGTPMATSDTRAIVEAAVNGEAFVPPSSDRVRYHALGGWHRGRHPKNVYKLDTLWKISGPKLNRESWKKIKPESLARP